MILDAETILKMARETASKLGRPTVKRVETIRVAIRHACEVQEVINLTNANVRGYYDSLSEEEREEARQWGLVGEDALAAKPAKPEEVAGISGPS